MGETVKNTDTVLPGKSDEKIVQEVIEALNKGDRAKAEKLSAKFSPAQQRLLVKMIADAADQARVEAGQAAAATPGNQAAAQAVIDKTAGVPTTTYGTTGSNSRPMSGSQAAALSRAGYRGVDVAAQAGVTAEPEVRRKFEKGQGYGVLKRTQTISSYEGEYGQRVNDNAFRDWMTKRLVVVGGVTPKGVDLISGGNSLWKTAGSMVASNPTLKATMTPEEWLDLQYRLKGGDAAYNAILADEEAKANPITHDRQVQSYTVSAAQAQAAVDDISQVLLGRMASDAELKKARGAMQKLLTATVTNTTTDRTDPSNVRTSSHTNLGVGPNDAAKILEMRMQRSSEGQAANLGQMFEQALAGM